MKVAVLSDIHDEIDHLDWARQEVEKRKIELCICCGDFSSPSTLARLAHWRIPVHFCLGNTDESSADEFSKLAASSPTLHFAGRRGRLKLEEGEVFFTHYPEEAMKVAHRGGPIAVFFGHSHRRFLERLPADDPRPACLLANPGDLQNRYGEGPGFIDWDTRQDKIEFVIRNSQEEASR